MGLCQIIKGKGKIVIRDSNILCVGQYQKFLNNTHSNPILRNKPNPKNKIYINNKKNSTIDEDKIPKENNNIEININNSINV